jgi:hypothetical protein
MSKVAERCPLVDDRVLHSRRNPSVISWIFLGQERLVFGSKEERGEKRGGQLTPTASCTRVTDPGKREDMVRALGEDTISQWERGKGKEGWWGVGGGNIRQQRRYGVDGVACEQDGEGRVLLGFADWVCAGNEVVSFDGFFLGERDGEMAGN